MTIELGILLGVVVSVWNGVRLKFVFIERVKGHKDITAHTN